MNSRWFIDLLRSWEIAKTLSSEQAAQACRLIKAASISAGGRVVPLPQNADLQGVKIFAVHRAKASLDRYAKLKLSQSSFASLVGTLDGPEAFINHLKSAIAFARERDETVHDLARDTLLEEFQSWQSTQVIGQTLMSRLHPVKKWRLLEDGEYLAKVVELIDLASTEILVAVAVIVWDGSEGHAASKIYDSLCYALRRNVRVEICDPGQLGFFSGTRPGRQMRTTLAKLHELGASIITSRSKRPLHAKLVIVDRKIVTIGSHNWTGSSLSELTELSVLCESPALATAFVERFRLAGYLGADLPG